MNHEIDQIGQTAFIIAAWRAAASERPAPLISDHLAHLFLDPAAEELAARMTAASPLTQHLICLRTRYLDERLALALAAGTEQILLLGAGLDTRALRFGQPGVRFFELDRPAVLEFKARRLARHGYDPASALVPGDYLAPGWWAGLEAAGFEARRATLVIWEGNSMYIPEERVEGLLRDLQARLPRLTLAFDYLSRRLLRPPAGQRSRLVDSFAALDAPWITGFDSAAELAPRIPLAVQDDCALARWGANLRPRLPVDPRLLDDYFICTLGQGAAA